MISSDYEFGKDKCNYAFDVAIRFNLSERYLLLILTELIIQLDAVDSKSHLKLDLIKI